MLVISPIKNALVPSSNRAAQKVSAPNYDEFQSDKEIFNLIQKEPSCVLSVTMAHCDVQDESEIMEDGSDESLQKSTDNMSALIKSELTNTLEDIMYVYQIDDPKRPNIRQIGLGCMTKTSEIRTENNPKGSIIRNEGVREKKAQGRANLVNAAGAFIGTVNNAIDDKSGEITKALEDVADSKQPDFVVKDYKDNTHKIWLVTEKEKVDEFIDLFAKEPHAYVADGNHRSAAAVLLGLENFLTVFFVADTMRIDPYHRLVKEMAMSSSDFLSALEDNFTVEQLNDEEAYQPDQVHEIGLYVDNSWYKLIPKEGTYDASDAEQDIDANIVQRNIFDKILGISDAADKNFTYVGGDRGATYLKDQVDAGNYDFAVSMAPVTMEQFIEVCNQNKFMPPKSTWFEPKIRSGLVMALI